MVDPELQTHRALSSPVRARLLDVLRAEPDLDAAALALRLGLHLNTVRSHLGVLEDAGLVGAVVESRDRPGRPRLLYHVVPTHRQPVPATDDSGYRFLASILAGYLGATVEDASSAAEEAGRAWGGFVVDKPAPFREVAPTDAVDRLVAMLDEIGFAPELDDTDPGATRLVLHRCPFLDVAREHRDVVCSIHLGLMRGALDELGADVDARDLIPWAEPDACVAHLETGERRT